MLAVIIGNANISLYSNVEAFSVLGEIMKRIFASIIVIMLFLTACSSESEILPNKESLEWNMRLNQIFEIENAQDFVYAMCDYIGEKCEYGMNMSVLGACE